jgi:hypothetical protein
MKYVPTFSCDAERIFSEYMNIPVINMRESLFKNFDAPHNDKAGNQLRLSVLLQAMLL